MNTDKKTLITTLTGTVDASALILSEVIDVRYADGFFSLQIAATGSGMAKVEYLVSNDGVNFVAKEEILSGFTSTSGPDSDGNNLVTFDPQMCRNLRIRCTETGGVDSITVVITLAIQ